MKHPACDPIVRLSLGVLFAVAACGKSSSTPGAGSGTGGQGGGGGGGGGISGTATGCSNNQVTIVFSPMYSAFDGVHHFQIPAVVSGIDPDAVKWSASDPSMVDIAADDTTGGAMITVQKAGEVSIIATAGNLCGASKLTITAATTDDWEAGSARYNDGVVITRPPRGGFDGGTNGDAGDAASPREAACTNCHGDNATLLQYKTVQHTPEQAGGFSDAELKNIFMNGMVPMGGYFDTMIVPYATWQTFHKWQMTDDEAKGIIVYLRSLTPSKQTGSGNFGGRFDGGFPERTPRDGGGREGGGREGGGRPETGNTTDVAADVASD